MVHLSPLGQAKLISSFPFQDFQNMMRAGGHYSLFIIAKNLYNHKKTAETSNYEILNGASKINVVVIMHSYNETFRHYQKSMWVETGN